MNITTIQPPANWRDLKPHPLSALAGFGDGIEMPKLAQAMRINGYDDSEPIVMLDGMILDGRHRHIGAQEADVVPAFAEFTGKDPLAYVVKKIHRQHLNESQRAMFGARMLEFATKQVSRPANLPVSQTEAAKVVNVSERTMRDAVAVNANGTDQQKAKVDSGEARVSETAKQIRDEPILCDRCQRNKRIGQAVVKSCEMCRELRPKKDPKPKGDTKHDKPGEKDAFGVELPKRCRSAYMDPWLQSAIDFLGVMSAKFWAERIADGMKKRAKHYPFVNAKDVIDGYAMAGNAIDDVLDHLKANRPAGVCPSCDGKGCPDCKQCGLVPRELHAKLKAKVQK